MSRSNHNIQPSLTNPTPNRPLLSRKIGKRLAAAAAVAVIGGVGVAEMRGGDGPQAATHDIRSMACSLVELAAKQGDGQINAHDGILFINTGKTQNGRGEPTDSQLSVFLPKSISAGKGSVNEVCEAINSGDVSIVFSQNTADGKSPAYVEVNVEGNVPNTYSPGQFGSRGDLSNPAIMDDHIGTIEKVVSVVARN